MTAAGDAGPGAVECLRVLLSLFEPVVERVDAHPIHWISGGDAGPDWCGSCCRAVARHQRRTREYPEARVDGGWDDRRESDSPTYCHGCGRLLGYTLNSYGLSEEIAYWLDDGGSAILSSECVYEVHAVLDAAYEIGTDQNIADAVTIGERMAPLLPISAARTRGGSDAG